jgi:hypothetical protein
MAKYVKVAGAWKAVSPDTDSVQTAYVKVDGKWLGVTNAYVKVAGTWRSIFTYSAFIVPNVVNQVLATGRANITNSGNTAGTNTILNNANGATPDNNGKISTQSVTPGVYLSAQTVNLSYYVFAFITVPNLLGQTASAADTLLSNSGNTKGSVVFTASGATANNHATVASQTIPAGSAYTTAQIVGYTLYNYTVPTPSRPSVSLVSKGSNTFTFSTFFGANTTSALAYYGPSGSGNQVFWGTINSNGGQAVVTGLTPGASYSFMSYPVNTEFVNTLGSVQQGGLPSLTGSGDPVTLDTVPPPSTGSISQNPSSGAFNIGTTITASSSGWNNNPTSVEIKLVRGTAGVVEGEDPAANPRATGSGTTSASLSYPVTQADYDSAKRYFRAFARATNASGLYSNWIQTGIDIGPINAPGPTPPNPPGSVNGTDDISPVGGTFRWTAGSGGSGSYSYLIDIYNNSTGSLVRSAGTGDQSYAYTQAGTFYARVSTFDLGTGLTSTTYTQSPPVTFTGTAPAPNPTITATNRYVGGSPNTWELTISNSGGAATSYSWGLQFSNANGGTVLASTTGSGGTIAAGGSVTVTRNSSTYTWARWVSITTSPTATNGTQSTSWE